MCQIVIIVFLLKDLDVQLFNLLGFSQKFTGTLYGKTQGQKNVLKLLHYGYSITERILKSAWEKRKTNSTWLIELPVDIPFIPFGESSTSEMPSDEMTLRSLDDKPAWGGKKVCCSINALLQVRGNKLFKFSHFRQRPQNLIKQRGKKMLTEEIVLCFISIRTFFL